MAEQYRALIAPVGASAVDRYEQTQLPAGTRCRVIHRLLAAAEIELEQPIAGERRWFVAAGSLRFEEEG